MWVAAVCDLFDVVCGQIRAWVWASLVAGAPVAEGGAVLIDGCFASGFVGFACDFGGCGIAAVAVVVALVRGAAWSVLEFGAAGLSAGA